MASLTRDAIERVLGPMDNALAAEIARLGVSEQELAEAHAWVTNDEPLVNDFRRPPTGRVVDLIELFRSVELPQDGDV